MQVSEAIAEECSVQKGAPTNFAKFTGKYLSQMFSREFCEACNKTFFIEHYRWMLFNTAPKMKCPIKDFFSKCEEILHGKLHLLCSASV